MNTHDAPDEQKYLTSQGEHRSLNVLTLAISSRTARIKEHMCSICTSFPMMSMSGSLNAPGPATSVKPSERRDALAQKTMMLFRLAQVDWMSTQFRHKLQCRLSASYGI